MSSESWSIPITQGVVARVEATLQYTTANRYRLVYVILGWFYLIAAIASLSIMLSSEYPLSPSLWSVYGQWGAVTENDGQLGDPQLIINVDANVYRTDPLRIEWFLVIALWLSAAAHGLVALSSSPQFWARAARVAEEGISSCVIVFAASVYYGAGDVALLICISTMQAVAALLDGMPRRKGIATVGEWSKLGYSILLRTAIWISLALTIFQAPSPQWHIAGLAIVHCALTAVEVGFKFFALVTVVAQPIVDVILGNLALATKSYVVLTIISMAQLGDGDPWDAFVANTCSLLATAVILSVISTIIVRQYPL